MPGRIVTAHIPAGQAGDGEAGPGGSGPRPVRAAHGPRPRSRPAPRGGRAQCAGSPLMASRCSAATRPMSSRHISMLVRGGRRQVLPGSSCRTRPGRCPSVHGSRSGAECRRRRVEQADQAAGTDVADLALIQGELEEPSANLPGVGSTILIRASAVHRPQPQQPGLAHHAAPDTAPASGTQASGAQASGAQATAIPYFQWDNRDGHPMQVWIPTAGPSPRTQPLSP